MYLKIERFNPSDQGAQDPDVLHGSLGGEQAESGPNPQVYFNIRIFSTCSFLRDSDISGNFSTSQELVRQLDRPDGRNNRGGRGS